jgi:hypothetical protein
MADLMTDEVAERYNVLAATVRYWCRRGLFEHAYEEETPRGRVWRIPEADLVDFSPPKKTGRPPTKRKEAA